ncbi:MAG: ferrous iron transport protein B [Epsilonproteobacteria bacterium]|nr:ferrous iron transport protein B [Campylobacterota bacterium]
MEKTVIKVALVGQPNVGKSMLINSISNSRLKVGNFSGVTVEKSEVNFEYCDEVSCKEYLITIIDLPGAYSLSDFTLEERVTKNFLEQEPYDVILNVLDSTNLERNLLLTTEILEKEQKTLIALNMIDEASKEGIEIDEKQLSHILGVACIKTSAKQNIGIDALKERIVKVFESQKGGAKIAYSKVIEEEVANLNLFFKEKHYRSSISYRQLSLRLLQEDKETYEQIHNEPIWTELSHIVADSLNHIYIHYDTKDLDEIFAQERQAISKGASREVQKITISKGKTVTEKLDDILIHPIFGIPIFFALMWTLFQLTFEIGSIPMDMIDTFFASLAEGAVKIFGEGELGSVISDGIIAGVGAVVLFLPNIAILFLGIALLETTGYMSRVAFLLDGFFYKFGLHGKSFIPLVTGFGCSVPAYMAARTLKNEKDRLITLFIIGFMSCGARLPIYVLFAGAFFAKYNAGNVLFVIYITGAFLGLLGAKVLKVFVFKGEDEPFVMEMPKYRRPALKLIWHTVWSKSWLYLKKAGTFILLASVLIWFASTYPKYPSIENAFNEKIEHSKDENLTLKLENEKKLYMLENSYLGKIGHFSEPFFAPLGFDWKMTISLETGLAAKEVVVSTLGVLYSLGDEVDEKNSSLIEQIKANIPFASALAFIVFVMVYIPCLAASMVFMREAGGWKYLVYLFIFTTSTAWILSFITYNIARMV